MESNGKDKRHWLDWLSRRRQHVLTAVDSGDALQLTIRVNPMPNRRCIKKWEYLPDPGDETTLEWPAFAAVAERVEELAKIDGLNPNHDALHHFSGLVACPGFCDGLTKQPVRLLHPSNCESEIDKEAINGELSLAIVEPPAATTSDPKRQGDISAASRPPKKHAGNSRRRILPSPPGQPPEPRTLQFYCKIDAAKVLSKSFLRYADQANYIQHRILMGRLLGDLDETATFTLLKSDYLRQVIDANLLKPLLTEMQTVGLIERDNHYVIGEKSYGYRFASDHAHAPTIRVGCRRVKFGRRIQRLRHEDFRGYKAVHKHLFGWLNRLTIDHPMADGVIDSVEGADWMMPVNEVRDVHRLAVQAIADRQWEFRVCDYGRVHTNITRLLQGLRSLLTIEGQQLVTIDIANSQPLFLLAALLTAGDSVAGAQNGIQKGGFRCRKALYCVKTRLR